MLEAEEKTLMDAIWSTSIIALINQKFVENYDNTEKSEVLNELLNEVKLLQLPSVSRELH